MKFKLTLPGLALLALPTLPVVMFAIPPLANARDSRLNMAAFGLAFVSIVWNAVLVVKAIRRISSRNAVKRLLNERE